MLSPDELALAARSGQFARAVVAANAPGWAREGRLDRQALRQAAVLGLTGICVPPAHGGRGFSFGCKARIAEILASADFGFAMSTINTQNVADKLAREAQPEVAAEFVPALLAGERVGCTALTEPGAGSDFAAIKTTATAEPDGWRLDGRKQWIINATEADVMIVYAQTLAGSGARGIAAFVVDGSRPGFSREIHNDLGGQQSIGTAGFSLTQYKVRANEMLQPPGAAFKAAMRSINGARTYVAAMCCGMLEAALDVAGEYGHARQTFGRKLLDHQGWRWKLAGAATDLAAARQLVAAASTRIDHGLDAQLSSAQAKVFSTRVAACHLIELSHLMGAEGLRDVYPFSRHILGARMASLTDGASEMLLERIAALLFRQREN